MYPASGGRRCRRDPNASFQSGWHHDGGTPDQLLLSQKYMYGIKVWLGTAAYVQGRAYGMVSGAIGFTFSDAGKAMFGLAMTTWSQLCARTFQGSTMVSNGVDMIACSTACFISAM